MAIEMSAFKIRVGADGAVEIFLSCVRLEMSF